MFKRAGELGILGAHFPEEHGGQGLDYWFSVVKAEELPRARSGGVGMGLVAAVAVQEEIGRAACPTPLTATLQATFVLSEANAT